jgi:cobalt-zinc-cadmium efflux system protein
MGWALAFTVAFGVAQVIAGYVFDSLALVADAVHNVSDGVAIGLALGAAWLAGLPARGARTFGWKRAEVLAGLVNAIALVVVGLWVLWEAWQRLDAPPDVVGPGVLIFGALGIVANGIPVVLLWRSDRHNINVRAAMLHALADVLGSAAALVAGLLITFFGWERADPILAAVIGVVIIASAWGVLREAVIVLLEAAPPGLDPDELARAMAGVPGVRSVHDVHVWTITSGFPVLAAHAVVAPGTDHDRIRAALTEVVQESFRIDHVTLQLETDRASGLVIHRRGCPDGPRARAEAPGSDTPVR